ncbi:MAG: aldehyde dehydrogenase [Gammaproteobacteria bacterium RIFCSPHIGHO2_12_FULL_35_23]|nr:MAG: aldehyde dehydrogenase [Gammaproteobacteria bacterium RIFCSPHIGHO2_12_FULL_35_23]
MSSNLSFLKTLQIDKVNSGSFAEKWLSNKEAEIIDSISPTNSELIAKIRCSVESEYEAVVHSAQTAFKIWRDIPAPKRGEIVRQLGNALREYKDALGSLVSYEMGKSKQEGDGEVQEMIDIADFAVGQSRMLYGKTMHSERLHHRMYEQWHPLGPVGIISAFNFPVAVWSWNAFLAAICGNTCIWKPSLKTPLCAIAVQHICNTVFEKNKLPNIFSLFIPKDHDLVERFVQDERVPLISFTGSSAVGKEVGAKVARRFGKSILELGGNNAIIVDETADLKLAVPAIVFGAVGTAGQRCTTTRRLIVQESIAEKLEQHLINAYQQISIGDPLDQRNLMGPLIDEAAVENYRLAVNEAKQCGGQLLFGGKVLEKEGCYVEPTLIKAKAEWEVVQRETFASILYILTYKTLEEAVAIQNSVRQGLSSAIFTTNLKNAEYFLSVLGSDCGIANVNIGTSGAEIGGAFGGEKETGGGRESGSNAWQAYMRRQTNTINWSNELLLAQGIKFSL